jgi:hypothetical protein
VDKLYTQAQLDKAVTAKVEQVRDELIQRHRCGCEVCVHSAELCPASKSSIALEPTSLERRAAKQRLEEASMWDIDGKKKAWREERIAALRKQAGK